MFDRFRKEFEYYHEFYIQSINTVTPSSTSKSIGDSAQEGEQDSSENEHPHEEVKIPDNFMELVFTYFGMLLVCTTSGCKSNRVRRIAHNVDENRRTKRRNWMNHYIERIFWGDPFLVDRAMIDVLKFYKYEERRHVISNSTHTTSVSQFQLLAQGKIFSQQFSQSATRLDIGDEATKRFVGYPFPVCAQRPTPFMRISITRQNNDNGEWECAPSQYEDIGMAHHLLKELKIQLDSMIQDRALIHSLFATLLTQPSFKETNEKDFFSSLDWFLTPPVATSSTEISFLQDFFYNWSPEYKCDDGFWNDYEQQPKLSEKLVRLLWFFVTSTKLLVSDNTYTLRLTQ